MAEFPNPETPVRPKRRRRVQAAIGALLIALFVFAAWYLRSPQFNAYVRARVVAQIENATGGRVDMKALRWNLSKLSFEIDDLTIHGLEAPTELPYAHVDKVIARAKIISFWQRDIGLHLLELHHPVIHLITYADGTTNQPAPKVRSQRGQSAPEYVFDLAIERAELHDGLFVLNDRALPFDFNASGLQAAMTYARADHRYDGSVHADKLDAKLQDMRPVSAEMDAEFSVFSDRAQLRSLKLSTGRSQLTATGAVSDFSHPKATLAYSANLNVGEVGGIARIAQLRAGNADIKGHGTYEASRFQSNGALVLKQAEYVDGPWQLRNSSATADYKIDPATLTLDKIVARVFGGEATGSAVIRNWRSGPAPNDKEQQQGTAHFKVAGLSVAELAQSLSSKDLPLAQMKPVGATSGDVNVSWKGSLAKAAAELALNVAPPAQPSPQRLPVTAHIKASVAAGGNRVNIAELSLATRATHLTASGTLGARDSNVKLSVATTDMGEFKPLLATLQENQPPVDVHGSASFNGNVSGTVRAPTVVGHLEIRDFDSVLVAPPPAAKAKAINAPLRRASAPAQPSPAAFPAPSPKTSRIHWDALTADVQYSPAQATVHNGVLRRGTAQLNFDGTTALTKGQFTDSSLFSARVNLRDGNIADVQSLLGLQYPVSGTINVTANVDGTQRNSRGQGRLVITHAIVRGEAIRQLTSDIRFADQEAQLTNIDLAHNGSHVTGSAAYNITSKAFRFDLASTGIDLATIRELRSRIPVAGVLAFTAKGSGTPEQPIINAHVRLSNMFSGGEKLGDITADAVTTGDTVKITGRSNFQNSDLRLDGTVHLREDFPAQLTLQAQQVDIDPLLRAYIKGQVTAHSRLAGTVEARGPLKQPRLMTVNGAIQQLSAEVEHIGIRNDGPIEFAMQNQIVTIRRMRLVGDNTQLDATGTINLAATRRIDVRADGQVNMRLVQTFNPDFRSGGLVTLNARATGTLAQPAIFGTLKVTNGSISYIDLPNGLADINGTLAFNQDRLQIQQLTARTGGGTLNLGGFITYGRNVSFNITANAKDMRLRYPPGVSSQADADLRLTGTLKASVLSGDIVVTKFGVNPRFDFALYLARAKQAPQTPNPDSLLNNLRLDVHIASTPELQVQTSLARISGNADLRVRGSGTRPSVLGRVSIIEGEVFFNGTKYHLERGDITFTNPVRIEPVMDMEATTAVRNYDITLGFHGRMDALSVNYRSDPPLSSGDIIELLAFGRTQEEAAQQSSVQSNFTESASNAILSQALNAAVSSRVQKLFGVTRVKVDPRIGGAENNPSGARVTVEQQVANNLTLTYITDLTRSTQQVIQVEYNINHNLSLTAVRDQNGVVGIDIKLRQRKR